MNQKIFVLGATGFQGGHIAAALMEQGHTVKTLTTNEEKLQAASEKLEISLGNLADTTSLSNALKGIKTAVFTLPLVFDIETSITYTNNFIEGCKANNVNLVVFNTGFDVASNKIGLTAVDLKVTVKELLDTSGLNVITLMPDIYVDNLVAPWAIPVILEQGILPYPVAAQKKMPWISHVDLGRYVAAAIGHPELAGQTLAIGGNLWTGEEIAIAIGKHLNKEVQFVSLKPDDFEQQLAPAFGEVPAREISNLYRYLEQDYERIINKNFEASQELLSINPQSISEWVESVQWYN